MYHDYVHLVSVLKNLCDLTSIVMLYLCKLIPIQSHTLHVLNIYCIVIIVYLSIFVLHVYCVFICILYILTLVEPS